MTKKQRDGLAAASVAGIGIIAITMIVIVGVQEGHDGSLIGFGVAAIGVIVGGIGHFGFTRWFGK